MRFDWHEWVKDMVTRAIAGAACGAAGAMLGPNPQFLDAIAGGGVVGLVGGLLIMPIKWLLSRGDGPGKK